MNIRCTSYQLLSGIFTSHSNEILKTPQTCNSKVLPHSGDYKKGWKRLAIKQKPHPSHATGKNVETQSAKS